MATAEMVRDIVSTYELPPKLEQRVTSIASLRTTELGLGDFNRVYMWVGHLVESYTAPYAENRALRFDRPNGDGY